MMNSPGVVLTISLVLAREAGVKDDVVDDAIERSAKLLRFYIGKGAIPYGDHSPWMEGHEDNGKCGMAAVLFNSLGEAKGAEFFSRMSVAAHGPERDCGHCGNYFNMLWAMPSVALSGPNATGAWMKEFGTWYFDLARHWDGKVFILAGQSNMQGHANISTFDSLADDPKTAPLLKELRGPDGKPRVCEKVWISSVGCLGDAYSDLTEAKGKLTAGFGAPENKIGPEFTFGLTMEQQLNEPVLIIKTSWGGRSLHTDFRPPSGGAFAWGEAELARRKNGGEDIEKLKAEKVKDTGVYYREMIAHVRNVLKDIKRVVPDYDATQGYELAGFVWFQGFNDYVDGGVYPEQDKAGGYDLYAELLGHFIRDVRKDLSAPKLPFVIGVMGIDGLKGDKKAPMMHFRAAQRKPTTLDEFKGNVLAVETAPFWDDELEALQERMENHWPKVDAKVAEQMKDNPKADAWENKMKLMAENFTPEEWKRLQGASNGGYHYLGAAKILGPIGKAFAEALVGIKAVK